MTGGQVSLSLGGEVSAEGNELVPEIKRLDANRKKLIVQYASQDEVKAHEERLKIIVEASGGACIWLH